MKNLSTCVFVPPSTLAWAHAFVTHLGLTIILGAPLGILLHRLQQRLYAGVVIAIGVALAVPLAVSHIRVAHPGVVTWMTGFLCATFAFSVFFKSLAAAFATFPIGANADLRTWLTWFLSLPEPSFAKGKLRRAPAGEAGWRSLLLSAKLAALCLVLTLLVNAPSFEPFGSPADGVSLPGRALRHLLNGADPYLSLFWYFILTAHKLILTLFIAGASHLWLVYLWASLCLDVGCLLTLVVQV